jgi:hypothetical protein
MSGRCKACNVILTEDELTSKYPGSNEFIELCFKCLDMGTEGEEEFDDLFDEENYEE